MKFKKCIIVFFFVLLNLGCFNAVKVRSVEKDNQIKGIPFFLKKAIGIQTTVYLLPYYEVSLFIIEQSNTQLKKNEIPDSVIQILMKDKAKVINFKDKAIKMTSKDDIKNTFIAIGEATFPLGTDDMRLAKEAILELNETEQKMVVDTSKKYYLNYRVPLSGKGIYELDLNDDYTLKKIKGETESQILEKVIETIEKNIPIKSYLEKILKITETEAKTRGKSYKLEICFHEKKFRYIFQKIHDKFDTFGPIKISDIEKNSKIIEVKSEEKMEEDKKEEDGKKITIRGEVKLPKEKNN